MDTRFGAFTFHRDRRQVLRDGREVHLTPKAFDLLALLIERAPSVVTKDETHARLWPDTFVSDATLVGVVKELRHAIDDDDLGVIRTVHRVGYAFSRPDGADPSPPRRIVTCWLVAGDGERLPLHDGENVIGRAADAAVWCDVAGISRHHACITVANGVASIEDMGSKNGTMVCGSALRAPAALRDGDRIQLATEVFVFRTSFGGMSTATAPRVARDEEDDRR